MSGWHPMTDIPQRQKPILMRGGSGYMAPHCVRYEAGYYDAEFRPLNPWLTFDGNSIEDGGPAPREWRYLDEPYSGDEMDLRRILREELDRKPTGYAKAAEAAIAWARHNALSPADWNPSVATKLEDAAVAAVKELDNGH